MLSVINEEDILLFKKETKGKMIVTEYQVIEINPDKKTAVVEEIKTGQTKIIKRYEGRWKMKGGLLIRKQ